MRCIQMLGEPVSARTHAAKQNRNNHFNTVQTSSKVASVNLYAFNKITTTTTTTATTITITTTDREYRTASAALPTTQLVHPRHVEVCR